MLRDRRSANNSVYAARISQLAKSGVKLRMECQNLREKSQLLQQEAQNMMASYRDMLARVPSSVDETPKQKPPALQQRPTRPLRRQRRSAGKKVLAFKPVQTAPIEGSQLLFLF